MRLVSSAIFSLCFVLAACSKDKEQCHALVLAVTEADSAYLELSDAAARGNRPKFEQAKKEFEAALPKLAAVPITGSGLRAEEYAFTQKRYLAAAPKIVPAYARLLAAVEKNPDLGKKHMDGIAFLGSLDDLPADVKEADMDIKTQGHVTRDLKCD